MKPINLNVCPVSDGAAGRAYRARPIPRDAARNGLWSAAAALPLFVVATLSQEDPPSADEGPVLPVLEATVEEPVILATDPGDPGDPQDLPYDSGSTGADGPLTFLHVPPGRYSPAIAYDPDTGTVLMHGGFRSTGYSQQTWQWDGTDWSLLLPPLPRPETRHLHSMVYDEARDEFVMFGGTSNQTYGDTWVFKGGVWTRRQPADSPSPRYGHTMAYDPVRETVLLFGGWVPNIGSDNETWQWDGANWTMLNPPASPSNRYSHAMTYDAARQEIVLFGGNSGGSETWIWNGLTWTQRTPQDAPDWRQEHTLTYDAARQVSLLFGGSSHETEIWTWNGVNWTQVFPNTSPSGRDQHAAVYDASRERILLFGGSSSTDTYHADTWLWDGTDWALHSDKVQFVDMSEKSDGIWNHTTIEVPENVTVRFLKDDANSPVRWLATGKVVIDGTVDVSGEPGRSGVFPGNEAQGGPGGFAGGLGGVKFNESSSFAGTPGQGPGGGLPGVERDESGKDGGYSNSYGNAFIQPLIGGSGGGGGGSTETSDGGNGGGGGGAILIASSRDIAVNGAIWSIGGNDRSNVSIGGDGSGGAIRLIGDRVSGSGELRADGNGGTGRIRIEGFFRFFDGSSSPTSVKSGPVETQSFDNVGALQVVSVAGETVAQPPSGSLTTPDVIFERDGDVTVVVAAQNIPDGTAVSLRITSSGALIEAPGDGESPILLSGGQASFTVNVPKGVGTIQATAQFTLSP